MGANIISKSWRKTIINQRFKENFVSLPLESCLNTVNPHKSFRVFLTNPEPKRFNYFRAEVVDENGEISIEPFTNESRFQLYHAMRWRILKRAEILDTCHEFTYSMFITLTLPQQNQDISEWLRKYMQHLKRKKYIIYNYMWVLEFGEFNTHPHYHIVVTFEKCTFDMVDFFPDKRGWIGRCSAELCYKSVYRYLCKYLIKSNHRCYNQRNYGLSNNRCLLK